MSVYEKLWAMLNKVRPIKYLISNSFSKVGNEDLDGNITDDIFFDEFHTISHKTFLRLATIVDVANDPNQNTLFVTGFRGSGKTTFANFTKRIIDGCTAIPSVDDTFHEEAIDKENSEIEIIQKHYNSSIDKAIELLSYGLDDEISRDNIQNILMRELKGVSIYINFEKETRDHKHPIEQVLNSKIKNEFKATFDMNVQDSIINQLNTIFKNSSKITDFESTEGLPFKKFADFICIEVDAHNNWAMFIEKLDENLSPLNINQLLCILSLINIIKNIGNVNGRRQFYVFDNIDIIQDDARRVLEDFLTWYPIFVNHMTELTCELSKTGIEIGFYQNMTFIFIMRETTTMLINDHFEDRLKDFSKHFDISSDIDKGLIIKKKRDFLKTHNNQIVNKKLISGVERIYDASLDYYVRDYIYSLFNNDYKRMISCIASICESDLSIIDEQVRMLQNPCCSDIMDSIKYGARSMLLRLILNHFKEKGYFSRIGIDQNIYQDLKYTPSRIILSYLFRYQSDHNEKFMISDERPVTLYSMFEDMRPMFNGDYEKSLTIFNDALWGMFSLRTSASWNHLITFDSIKSVSYDAIKNAVRNKETVYVRITCAGRFYLRYICTHFEFFACRYRPNSLPLFSYPNGTWLVSDRKYQFEKLIDEVFKKVNECCRYLLISEENIYIKNKNFTRFSLIHDNCFYYSEYGGGRTHSERILHNHINYLDAYRLYLINGRYSSNVVDINKRLLALIKKYLELMKPCYECTLSSCSECDKSAYSKVDGNGIISGHFSNNNTVLYQQLMACVLNIEEKGYDTKDAQISRDYFNEAKLTLYTE